MSARERWTVYPLLLLALMLAARDKLIPDQDVVFRRIECQELMLNTVNDERLIHLGESQDSAGMILVYAPANKRRQPPSRDARPAGIEPARTDQPSRSPVMSQRPGASGQARRTRIPIVEIGGNRAEGYVRVMSDSYPSLLLGHREEQKVSGLMGIDSQDDLLPKQTMYSTQYWGELFAWDGFSSTPATESTSEPDK